MERGLWIAPVRVRWFIHSFIHPWLPSLWLRYLASEYIGSIGVGFGFYGAVGGGTGRMGSAREGLEWGEGGTSSALMILVEESW